MLAGMMALAPELVQVLYGPIWMPMVVPLTILCVAGMERAVTSPVGPVLNATGKPRTLLYLLVAKLLIFAATIFPLTARFGIIGTSVAGAITSVLVFAYSAPVVSRLLGCKVSAILRALAGPFAAAGIMVASLLLLKRPGWLAVNVLSLGLLVILGALVYLMALAIMDRGAIEEVRRSIRSLSGPAGTAATQPGDTPAA